MRDTAAPLCCAVVTHTIVHWMGLRKLTRNEGGQNAVSCARLHACLRLANQSSQEQELAAARVLTSAQTSFVVAGWPFWRKHKRPCTAKRSKHELFNPTSCFQLRPMQHKTYLLHSQNCSFADNV